MTKQETIKNHYISEFINSGMSQQEAEQKWEHSEEFINPDDGYFQNREEYYRPISLRGIETNNSWIRVESEKDLPKEYDYFHLKLQSGDEIIAYNSMHRRLFVDCDDEIEYRFITHYAPIEKKSPPLH